jgi:CRP/FNR family transcriptional regulator, anaerobic regulatory protein
VAELDDIRLSELRPSAALLEDILQYGVRKVFSSGQTILQENATIFSIPLVIRGIIRVIRTEEDGREILLYYIKAGESCIMSFLGGIHHEPSKVRAEVEEEAELLFIPVDKVLYLIQKHPDWLDFIFRLYHKRFEELLDVINAIAFRKVDERLLDLLQKKSDLTGKKEITVTHEQLANELGTARVVISRLLKQLEENKKVQLGRNKITLL